MGTTAGPALPQLAHLHQIDELFTSAFTFSRPHRLSSSGAPPPERAWAAAPPWRRERLGRPAPPRRAGVFRRRNPPARAGGDVLLGIQSGLIDGQALPGAQGGELVGTGVDEAGLLLADGIVHRGQQEHHQGEQVDEPVGDAAAGALVIADQIPEKAGNLKTGILHHGGGKLPEQGGGHGVAFAVDGVVIFHMPGGDAPLSACHMPRAALRMKGSTSRPNRTRRVGSSMCRRRRTPLRCTVCAPLRRSWCLSPRPLLSCRHTILL